ncbi:MAG: hypothetical protein F4Z04_04775 [Acidobacteria bacterium]|nr:hypothetical protein [Acidobacteriota bacterium]MYD69446.1 hypothetical protein [Acidobacteriota bacterium]
MSAVLGKLETQAFAYIQMRGKPAVVSEEISGALSLTAVQTRELLSRLARRNLIARVRRGLYLVPPRIPPGGRWSPSEFMALETLLADRDGRHQMCGPSAFHRYGWDDQVPNRVYAYNNRLSGERRIGSATLTLIKVSDDRLGGVESFTAPDGATAVYSSRARSLIDAVYDWSRFGSLPRAYGWIRDELGQGKIDGDDLVNAAVRFGNTGTRRRIGALLEREGLNPAILEKLEGELPATSALIPWCPTHPKRGTVDRRWGVVFNE